MSRPVSLSYICQHKKSLQYRHHNISVGTHKLPKVYMYESMWCWKKKEVQQMKIQMSPYVEGVHLHIFNMYINTVQSYWIISVQYFSFQEKTAKLNILSKQTGLHNSSKRPWWWLQCTSRNSHLKWRVSRGSRWHFNYMTSILSKDKGTGKRHKSKAQ